MGEIHEFHPVAAKDEEEDSIPVIKQVELTVVKTDDPTIPLLTFRMWVLGITSCVLLSFVNQFFWYRTKPLTITSISAMIAVVPIGHLMQKQLPNGFSLKIKVGIYVESGTL